MIPDGKALAIIGNQAGTLVDIPTIDTTASQRSYIFSTKGYSTLHVKLTSSSADTRYWNDITADGVVTGHAITSVSWTTKNISGYDYIAIHATAAENYAYHFYVS